MVVALNWEVEEDTKYKFLIKTIGNKQFNNKDAEKACEISFQLYLKHMHPFLVE